MPVKITDPKKVILDLGLEPDGKAMKFLTSTIVKHTDKYVPMRTGTLAKTVSTADNKIIYEQEYASYVYTGKRRGKDINYRIDKHAYAGPYWVERMMSAEGETVQKEIQNYLDRGV